MSDDTIFITFRCVCALLSVGCFYATYLLLRAAMNTTKGADHAE